MQLNLNAKPFISDEPKKGKQMKWHPFATWDSTLTLIGLVWILAAMISCPPSIRRLGKESTGRMLGTTTNVLTTTAVPSLHCSSRPLILMNGYPHFLLLNLVASKSNNIVSVICSSHHSSACLTSVVPPNLRSSDGHVTWTNKGPSTSGVQSCWETMIQPRPSFALAMQTFRTHSGVADPVRNRHSL